MEAQAPGPTHPAQLVDDPLAPLRLQPLEQISNFWKRYDRLADAHDKTLMCNLNGNLDVLLIFAALFSAINTAFISITMPDLSPNPSDETNTLLRLLVMRADNTTLTPANLSPPFSPNSNSIIVNCLLYASLSCSLLAAVGAMMAKEWLLEDQGKLCQRKLNGVEQWHLEAVIKFLPNLLLLSVILFFAGIGIFLFPINTAVAGTVVAFSGLGMILSGIAIIAGAISPLCPYQSAASNAVRRISNVFFRFERIVSRTIVQPILRTVLTHGSIILETARRLRMKLQRLIRGGSGTGTPQESSEEEDSQMNDSASVPSLAALLSSSSSIQRAPALYSLATRNNAETNEHTVTAQAASWLLHTTSNRGDQVAAAQFLRSINMTTCTLVFEDSGSWRRLLSLAREALDIWDSQPSGGNREIAEVFGLALCHVPLPLPEDMVKEEKGNVFDLMSPQKASSLSEAFLHALGLVRAKYEKEDEERIFHLAFLFTLLSRGRMIREYQWANLSKLFLMDENPRPRIADNLLGMWAYAAYRTSGGDSYKIRKSDELIELGENVTRLTETLAYAIYLSDRGLELVQGHPQFELNAARAYFVCLRRARELARQSSKDVLDIAARGMADLIRGCFDPMIASDSAQTPAELVKLAKEAVLGLRDLIDAKGSKNAGSSVIAISESKQLLDRHLVDAVADMLLDNPKIPTDDLWSYRPFKPSIIRMLLWAWENTSEISTSKRETHEIFLSSCRLWAPLEKQVQLSRAGNAGHSDKSLTPDDLNRLNQFINYIRKDRNSAEFISRNADVGIML